MVDLAVEQMVARAREVLTREAAAVAALSEQMDAGLADVIQVLLDCTGHVLVTGAGTSSAMAERFAHLLSCVGTPALPISAADALHGGAGAVREGDVLYVISKGGQSAEVNAFAEIAKARGAAILAQTEDLTSPLAALADAVFLVRAVGEIDPYGMIATGSSLVAGATHPGGAVGKMLR